MAKKRKFRIFGYARTSTLKQELSLEAQEEKIEARARQIMAENDGAEYKGCFVEQESATFVSWEQRKKFQEMYRELERGDVLIIWRLTRIDRKPWRMQNALDRLIQELKCRVIVLELILGNVSSGGEVDLSTALGRSIISLLGMMSDLEGEARAQDTSAGMQRRVSQGYVFGTRPPLGMRFEQTELPEGDKTRHKEGRYLYRAVWDQEQCDYIRELWVRKNVFNEDMQEVAKDFCRRELTTCPGRTGVPGMPWVRKKRTADQGKEDAAPTKGLWRWRREKLNQALALMDTLLAAGTVPAELRIDEHVIRNVAEALVRRRTG